MLLDNFSTDGSSHPQHHGNSSGKRRSSVTFEDQVEHSKGICRLLAPQKIRGKEGSSPNNPRRALEDDSAVTRLQNKTQI